jgi:hypothetical protein
MARVKCVEHRGLHRTRKSRRENLGACLTNGRRLQAPKFRLQTNFGQSRDMLDCQWVESDDSTVERDRLNVVHV